MGDLSFDTSAVLSWLFDLSTYISILICLIIFIKAVSRGKMPAWWTHGLWLLLIIRMIIPWDIATPLSIFNLFPAATASDAYMPFLMEQVVSLPFFEKTSSTASLDKILLFVWLAGILFFGIAILYKNIRFWLAVRNVPALTDNSVLAVLEECRVLLTTGRDVKVIVTDRVKSPALFGYLKPRLLLPHDFLDSLGKDELRCVFLHELVHLKNHDIFISWLMSVLQVIHWFNPLIWYAFHTMRVDQEVACDAYVLSRIGKVKPADYACAIVDILERFIQNRQLPSLAGIIENKSQIRRRIAMIMNFKRHTNKMTIFSILILFAVGLVFFTSSSGLSGENEAEEVFVTPFNLYEADQVYKLNEIDAPPQVMLAIPPAYPFKAKEEKITGKVVLQFIVDTQGWACEPEIISAEPEGVFEEAALDALAEYRFKPAEKDGKAVACFVRLPVKFELEPEQAK